MEVASININEYVSSTCPLSHYLQNTPSCAKPSATDHYSGRYAYRTCRVVGPFNTLWQLDCALPCQASHPLPAGTTRACYRLPATGKVRYTLPGQHGV